jgi:hypothetical protein
VLINFELQSTFYTLKNILNMKISRTKFVIIFLVSAFTFQFISNLILVPVNGEWYPGTDSPIAWKRSVAAILYPVKIVLVGPLSPIFNDPDPAPPVRALACAIYWTVLALVIYFIISKIITRKEV